jgi:hypothetical protein
MKRLLLATFGVVSLTLVIYLASCGQTNPAFAPVGSSITIVGTTDQTWDFNCITDWLIPSSCYDPFRTYCVGQCELAVQQAAETESWSSDISSFQGLFDTCMTQYPTAGIEFCSTVVCDESGKWRTYCEASDNLQRAYDYISSKEGRCGYQNLIISALVTKQQQTASTGQTAATEPLNDVQVRWIAQGGELYEIGDVPGEVAPLANPHYDSTDERGISEVKYRLPFPNLCGSLIDYILTADIAVAQASVTLEFSVAEPATDDDVSVDDDTGAL